MATQIVINGNAAAPGAALVNVLDRGFLYGDSVFETLRTYFGRPFAFRAHLQRLRSSAERVLIPMPVADGVWQAEVELALELAQNPESVIRLMLTRGYSDVGGLDPTHAQSPTRVVIVAPLTTPDSSAYEHGVAAITYPVQRVADGTGAAGAKVGNYLVAVLAQHAARAAQAVEALVVDARGELIEGMTSNLFFVAGGALCTPPENTGILPGITRAVILDVARELGIPVEFRTLPPSSLSQVQELFISSSLREMVPVVRVDRRVVGAGVPGPVTRRLAEALRCKILTLLEHG